MSDNRYNGWTNYETWNAALWMGEAGNYYAEMAQECWDQADSDDRETEAADSFASMIEAEFSEGMPEVTGFYADVLGAALSSVNWDEIARNYIAEVEKA